MSMCVWEPDPACVEDAWNQLDAAVQERSLMLATSSLQMLTNYRVGTCPVKIRPCPKPLPCSCGSLDVEDPYSLDSGSPWSPIARPWYPRMRDGLWYNNCGCGATCAPLSEIDIPGPVGYISSFKIDGEEQDLVSGNWRLDNGHLLVWQGDGPSPVPETQDLNKEDTEVGTWSITYSQSYPVNEEARIAVTYLAMEFAKACGMKGKCSLPQGVTNVVRNGVSFSLQAGLFPGGLTGIEVVDAFILKWAPAGSPTKSASVFSPRQAKPRRTSSVPLPPALRGSL